MLKREKDRQMDKINTYRKKLENMIVEKNMKSDDEAVELSQELDKLIVDYYRIKKL